MSAMIKKTILLILIICFASLQTLAFTPGGGAAWKPPKSYKGEIKPWKPPKGVPKPPKTWEPPKTFEGKIKKWEPPRDYVRPGRGQPWQAPKATDTIKADPSAPTAPSPDSTIPTGIDQQAQPEVTQPDIKEGAPSQPTAPITEPGPEPTKDEQKLKPRYRKIYPKKIYQPPPPPPSRYLEPAPVKPPSDTIYPDKTIDPTTDYYRKY
jgi:hypothetical protein